MIEFPPAWEDTPRLLSVTRFVNDASTSLAKLLTRPKYHSTQCPSPREYFDRQNTIGIPFLFLLFPESENEIFRLSRIFYATDIVVGRRIKDRVYFFWNNTE